MEIFKEIFLGGKWDGKMRYPKNYNKNNPKILSKIEKDLKPEITKPFHYLFLGDVGCGKTYLAKIIEHNMIVKKELDLSQISSIQSARKHYLKYLELMKSDYSDKGEALDHHRRSISHGDFIILDDLGDEKPGTDAAHDYFAGVVEDRYDYIIKYEYTRTIITSNLNSDTFINMYGSRVFDRLTEKFTIMKFKPHSFRQEKLNVVSG